MILGRTQADDKIGNKSIFDLKGKSLRSTLNDAWLRPQNLHFILFSWIISLFE